MRNRVAWSAKCAMLKSTQSPVGRQMCATVKRFCRRCLYPLAPESSVCSECGRQFDEMDPRSYLTAPTRPRWWSIVASWLWLPVAMGLVLPGISHPSGSGRGFVLGIWLICFAVTTVGLGFSISAVRARRPWNRLGIAALAVYCFMMVWVILDLL